jgi:Spore germination protein
MLKRMTIKKLLITTSAIFALFLVYLIPKETTYDLSDLKQNLKYVNSNVVTNEIYLLNKNNLLAKTKVSVSSPEDPEKRSLELLEYLIIESKKSSKLPNGFKAFLPEGTEVKSVKWENDVLKVDFSEKILDINKNLEEKMVEGIVYTLTTIENVENIIIYVEGTILTKLPKNRINLPSTLNRSLGINKEYRISSYKNVNKVTVYYLDTFNDETYYVPVTKYVNDEREKIDIIIEELSGNSSYNTNLMSYLNSNTRLMSYSKQDDTMNLVFNQYILDDIDERKILEEVVYTISLSVKENYDVKAVSFMIGEDEVYKSVFKNIE